MVGRSLIQERPQGASTTEAGPVLLAALAFLLPLVVNPFGYDIHDLPKVALLRLALLVLAGLLLRRLILARPFRRTALDLPVVFLVTVGFGATLAAAHRPTAFFGAFDRYEGWLSLASYALLFFAATSFVRKRQAARWVVGALVASSGVVALYALLQHFGSDILPVSPGFVETARSWSTFGNPTFLGAFLCLVTPLAMVEFLESKPGWWRLFLGADIFLLAASLAFTGTRGAWIGVAAGILVVALAYGRVIISGGPLQQRRALAAILAVLVLTGAALTLAGGPAKNVVAGRAQPVSQAASLRSRLAIWKVALSIVHERPLTGYGLDNFRYAFQQHKPENWLLASGGEKAVVDKAHNEPLQWAATAGMFGLLAVVWLMTSVLWLGGVAVREAYASARAAPHAVASAGAGLRTSAIDSRTALLCGLVASAVAYFVQLQASFSVVSVSPLFWLLLGILAAALPSSRTVAPPILAAPVSRFMKWSVGGQKVVIWVYGGAALLAAASLVGPLVADYHFARALALKDASQWRQAESEMRAATTANPGAEWYWIGLGQVRLPSADTGGATPVIERTRAAELAGEAFSKAIEANFTEAEGYFGFASAQSKYGEITGEDVLSNVKAAYVKALEVDPRSPRARFELGLFESSRGRFAAAIEQWAKVVRADPEDVEAHFNLARAYELTKQWKRALREYEEVRRLSPFDTAARDAIKSIKMRL